MHTSADHNNLTFLSTNSSWHLLHRLCLRNTRLYTIFEQLKVMNSEWEGKVSSTHPGLCLLVVYLHLKINEVSDIRTDQRIKALLDFVNTL